MEKNLIEEYSPFTGLQARKHHTLHYTSGLKHVGVRNVLRDYKGNDFNLGSLLCVVDGVCTWRFAVPSATHNEHKHVSYLKDH
jgi:hypothetical protein